MAEFDMATAVRRTGAVEGRLRYEAELDPDWRIGTKPNGGYLLALLTRAAVDAADNHPHPVAVSAHYLTAPEPGPARIEVEPLRAGRTASQLHAAMYVAGQRAVEALVTCGQLAEADAPVWDGVPAAELPPEAECLWLPDDHPVFPVPMLAVVQVGLDPATAGFAAGQPRGDGEIRGWVRFADGRQPDPLALLVALDCLPPATFDIGLTGWVPTLELTAYLRSTPAPGPLRVRQRVRLVTEGRVDEECDVWDSAGRLVATAHQLAGVRTGSTGAGSGTPPATSSGDLSAGWSE